MEKVKVTKEVAEIIESLREVVSDTTLIKLISDKCGGEYPLVTAAIAIQHGYEVEKTPEEKVREYYEETEEFKTTATERNYYEFCNGRSVGIRQTLRLLGIRIEGVNA